MGLWQLTEKHNSSMLVYFSKFLNFHFNLCSNLSSIEPCYLGIQLINQLFTTEDPVSFNESVLSFLRNVIFIKKL